MNYCTIEDAWKSSDHLTEQFSFYKKKTIENFEIQDKNQDKNQDKILDEVNNTNNTNNTNKTNKQINQDDSFKNNYLDNVFICNDFWDHLNKCSSCRNKMRQRFSSNVMEKFENVIIDNKDTILIFLICLFALIFCNLLVSIINK
jgi:hypothetical protein